MNQYEIEPMAALAEKLLLARITSSCPLQQNMTNDELVWAMYDAANSHFREGIKRGWIRMDPHPGAKK